MAMCAAVILTLAMAVLAVLLGLRWLIAVPLITAAAVLMDAAIFVRSRTRYMSLTAQAMCAEAAARQLRAQKKEKDRRDQAMRDLAGIKADALRDEDEDLSPRPERAAMPKATDSRGVDAPEEGERTDDQSAPAEPPAQAPRRRRRQATLTVLRKEEAK